MKESRTNLTSAEIASIWTSYLNNSMSNCILNYFLKHLQDEEIRSIVQFDYDLTSTNLKGLTTIVQEEGIPVPRNGKPSRCYLSTYR